jgi:hypothetical protein
VPAKKAKPRKTPSVQQVSTAEKAAAEKVVAEEAAAVEKETAWSKELAKTVKMAEAKVAKAAQTKAAKVAEKRAAKAAAEEASTAMSDASDLRAALQPERTQRIRKPATSKEVIPLTNKRKDTKENNR